MRNKGIPLIDDQYHFQLLTLVALCARRNHDTRLICQKVNFSENSLKNVFFERYFLEFPFTNMNFL